MRCFLLLASVALSAALSAQPSTPRLGLEIREIDQYRTYTGVTDSFEYYVGTTREWRGTLGGERIGEIDFYRLAGAEDLASRAASARSRKQILTGVGVLTAGAGIALFAVELSRAPVDDDGSRNLSTLGAAGLGGAVIGLGITVQGVRLLGRNATSADQAISALNAYQRRSR